MLKFNSFSLSSFCLGVECFDYLVKIHDLRTGCGVVGGLTVMKDEWRFIQE